MEKELKPNWQKNIILFLGSQSLTLFGSSLVQYAIFWYVTLNTLSGAMMTIYIICGFLPAFIISPFGGVWADRYHRKTLIILSDSLIALATLFLAILFLLGYDALWLLFAISAIRAFGTGVQTPAVGAVLPQLVPEDQLTRVNGINSSIQSFIFLLSPVASAALLTISSIEIIFFIDVITATLAIFIFLKYLPIPIHAKALTKQTSSYYADLKLGFTYINNHPFLKQIFLFCGIFFVLVAPPAFLTPLQVARSFGEEVWRLTAIEIFYSSGMMLGGVLIAAWGGFKNRIYTMAASTLLSGLFTIGLGVIPIFSFGLGVIPVFSFYLICMGLIGISMPFFNTPFTVLLQEKVEGDYLGRVFGVFAMISTSMMPLGMLVFGPVSDLIKIEWLLIGTGFLVFILSFSLVLSKVLVAAGKPNEPSEETAQS